MLQPGQIIGGTYRLDRVIGQGAFATVWAATSTLTERPVALKILADAPARRPTTVARFLKEAKICSNPIHPTMITVQDLGQTDEGQPYLVMELLLGHTLDQVLRAKGSLPWTMCVEIMQHVLSGLAAAHQRDIIHRDVKPSNIFLVEGACSGPPVRVLDLGLARDLTDDKRLTRTGQVVGTANYLPPETLLDEQPKGGTKAGDVFAAGMVMFVCLTGRFPFLTTTGGGTPAAEVFARASFYKSRAPLPGPREVDPSLPEPLDRVVRRSIAVDPVMRFADAREMLRELDSAMREFLPKTSKVELSQNLARTCLGLPSFLADADLIESGEAEVVDPFAGLGVTSASPQPPASVSPQPAFQSSPPPPAFQSSPPMAKTSVVHPIMVVGGSSSPAPPGLEPGRMSGAPGRSSRPSGSTRSSSPDRTGQTRLPGGSRPSWIRRSRVGLSLVGIAVGTLVGVMLLGGIVVWRLAVRQQEVDAAPAVTQQPAGVRGPQEQTTSPQQERAQVEMTLEGVPEGAQVRLDGQPVTGSVIRGTLGRAAVLEVEAPSIEPLRLELTFEAGRSIDLSAHLRRRQPELVDAGDQVMERPPNGAPTGDAGASSHHHSSRRTEHHRHHRRPSPAEAHDGAPPAVAPEAQLADPWSQ